MIKLVVDVFCVIVEIATTCYLYHVFFKGCKLSKRAELLLCIIAGCVAIGYSYAPITAFQRMCCSTALRCFLTVFYVGNWPVKLFFATLISGLNIGCEYLAMAILVFANAEHMMTVDTHPINFYIQGVFLSKALVTVITLFLASFKKQNDYYGKQGLLLVYMILPIITAISLTQVAYATELIKTDAAQVRFLCIAFAMIALNIALFFLLDRQMRMEKIKWQLKLAETRENMQQEYYTALVERDIEVSSMKHDMQNHLQYLKYKAENNDIEAVKTYIASLIQAMPQNKLHYTNQKTINTILNIKAKAAGEKEIVLDVSVPKEIQNLDISDMDLVILLANCLDNAIEAVEQLQDEKIIRLVIYDQVDGISILVENTYLPRGQNILFTTSKANRQEHGYGLQNIRRIVEKYSGIFRIETSDQRFKVKIFLPK